MSHRHKDCCCCKPVCSCGNSCGTSGIGSCGAGSGIWIIILLLVFLQWWMWRLWWLLPLVYFINVA